MQNEELMGNQQYAGKTGYGKLLILISNNVYLRSISRDYKNMTSESPEEKTYGLYENVEYSLEELREMARHESNLLKGAIDNSLYLMEMPEMVGTDEEKEECKERIRAIGDAYEALQKRLREL